MAHDTYRSCVPSIVATLVVAVSLSVIAVRSVHADDAAKTSPIVVEPAEDGQPTIVRLNPTGDVDNDPLKIDAFHLTDQNGESFDSKELAGHQWVAAFIFTRCVGFCPTLVRNLRREVADRVDDPDVRFVVITVDPETDTPDRLKQYAEIFVTDFDRWRFLTGKKSEIYKLVEHGFRLPVQEMQGDDRLPGFEVAHSLSLIHVGPDGRVIGKYDSRDEQQVLALRRVLNGQIETPEENRVLAPVTADAGTDDTGADLLSTPPAGIASDAGNVDGMQALPRWARRLPATNAMLNGLATLLLLAGFAAIKAKNVPLHKRLMLFAFATSVAFLGSYLTYHWALHQYTSSHGKPFEGTGGVRTAYFAILISHVLLAMTVPVLALITISRGLKGQWEAHKRIARVTFPIWLYVSVTGVIIYGMLYHWPV